MSKEWRQCHLGDIITLQRGFDLPERDRVPGHVPIVTSSGITGFHNVAKVTAPGVVTGRYGTLGSVHFVTKDFWPHNTTLYVKDFKGNDPRFISFFLQTLNFSAQNVAGAVPGINRNYLHLLEVTVPPRDTQCKIAAVLSAYDDLIENNTRRIAILEEMARSLYREWFVHFRFPGHDSTKLVDSRIGKIPEGWKATVWGELATLEYGKALRGYEGVGKQFPVFGTNGPIGWHDLPLCETAGVIIGRKGAYRGVHYSSSPFWVIDTAFYLKPKTNAIDVLWSYYQLLSVDINTIDSGSAIPSTSRDAFYAIPAVLPSPAITAQFRQIVNELLSQSEVFKKKNANLRSTRDLLLPKLINGQLDVESLDIDIGEVLEVAATSNVVMIPVTPLKTPVRKKRTTNSRHKDDAAIVCVLLDELSNLDTPRLNSELVIQKHVYGLLKRCRLTIHSPFIPYLYGPWSSELRDDVLREYARKERWIKISRNKNIVGKGRRFAKGLEHGRKLLGERYQLVVDLVQDLRRFGGRGLGRWMTVLMAVCNLQEQGQPVTLPHIQKAIDEWPEKREKPDFSVEAVEDTVNKMVRRKWFALD